MEPKTYDAIVLVTPDSFLRLKGQYGYYLKYMPVRNVYVLGSSKVGELLDEYRPEITLGEDASRLRFINEDDILTFDSVHRLIAAEMAPLLQGRELPRGITGWYYQQFLKLSYAYRCEDEYYLIWDGDTFPCCHFSMFSGTSSELSEPVPYLDTKAENHAEYFETMGTLIPGMEKVIGPSFISEHMLFKTDIVLEMLRTIEANGQIEGDTFWQKVIHAVGCDRMQNSAFSEYETYGTYVALCHPTAYRLRPWHSFRLGAEFFDPDTICERDYEWLGKDFTAISFEKNQYVREDHKNLFDNPAYQEKLSARQMLQVAQEAFEDGYTETWDDDGRSGSAANSTSGAFDDAEDMAPHGFVPGKDRLRYLKDDTWVEYASLGERLLDSNIDQAYLCFENALFLCPDEQKKNEIAEVVDELASSGAVSVRKTCFIILSYNNRYLIEQCLESIYSNCAEGTYSIVILDNASTDGVASWLKSLDCGDKITLLLSDENMGFAKGCNEAVGYADPDSDIFFLNNDTRLPANSLFWLRMGLYASQDTGAVGALQNYTSDQLLDVKFDLPEQYMEFGAGRNTQDNYSLRECDKLSGFAMLVRREVIDSVGTFDERFSPGYFEDDDLSFRIRQAGYRLFVCNNAFIYHVGSQAFARNPEAERIYQINREKFRQKWGFYSDISVSDIKMVIWDLDNTFWSGTLTEGGCEPDADNINLVRELTDRGIINSICSKNDHEAVEAILSSADYGNIWEYFVFADIDWTPKAARVSQIISDAALRPENVLFIDDEEFNLQEAEFTIPGIMVSGPGITGLLRRQLESYSGHDPEHKRLKQYKILEQKRSARREAGSDIRFLEDSEIRIEIAAASDDNLPRICELISRTNQLNYTKIRLSEDEVYKLIHDENYDCRLISLTDRYGDYGYIGFYAIEDREAGRLEHFLFSCRVMGMGVDAYIYRMLGCPEIFGHGVIEQLAAASPVTWISEEKAAEHVSAQIVRPKVLLKGPCDIDGITPYLMDYAEIELETNFVDSRNIVVAGSNNSMHLYEAYHINKEILRKTISDAPFMCETDFISFMFEDHYDAVIFSTLSEGHSGIYRNRETGVRICLDSFTFDITDPASWEKILSGERNVHNIPFTKQMLDSFASKFEFEGHLDPETVVRNLTWMRQKLDPHTQLILLMGSEIEAVNNTDEFADHAPVYRELNSRLYDAFAESENVWLLNMTDYVTGQDCFVDSTNHFSRKVYYEVAGDLIGVLNPALQNDTGDDDRPIRDRIMHILNKEREGGITGLNALADNMDDLITVYRRLEYLTERISRGEATEDEVKEYKDAHLSSIAVNVLLLNSPSTMGELKPISQSGPETSPGTDNSRFGTVYVLCPNLHKSGGPELLHQLVHHINELGGNAQIAYIMKHGELYAHPEFVDYVRGHMVTSDQIEDSEENVLIIPEGFPEFVDHFEHIHRYFWWMSVDNFKRCYDFDEAKVASEWELIRHRIEKHLCQSVYSYDYVKHNGIADDYISMLGDYLNDEYMNNVPDTDAGQRAARVLYNPIKDELAADLISRAPYLQWTPIQGMSTGQVRELMSSSRLYIDFGSHPGKDRLPREAAMSGCVVITGRRGSAAYAEDVAIPDYYRVDEYNTDPEEILRRIQECLTDFETHDKDMVSYREKIRTERDQFVSDVRKIFFETP